ncbi:hypothetical protein ACEQ8H_006314 [Pleosporales sp. CAS-2024a]
MTAPRLPFLWPMLYRNFSRPCTRATPSQDATWLASTCAPRCRQFATTPRRSEDSTTQRYGKAFEPAPHLRDSAAPKEPEAKTATPQKRLPERAPEEHEEEQVPIATSTPIPVEDAAPPTKARDAPKTGETKPLDSVLHMPSPQDEEYHKPPHLKTPPYVHHFDTYGLVKELQRSHYSPEQSETLMKAVRGILIFNMELAREGLVSKSNVENETYLFRAACSELQTEMGNGRKSQIERMRTERAQLQHEVDILGQRLGQETGTLKDELKGLFDDRKMAIQELNYKITVALNSDARSEVEGLRWVLTRRAAITVGVSAFMLFVALRYTSYVQHQQQEERRRHPPKQDPRPAEQESQMPQAHYVHGHGLHGRQEALGGELLAGEGGSLG